LADIVGPGTLQSEEPSRFSEGIQVSDTTIRFISLPLTEPPPHFVPQVVQVFRDHESAIATLERDQHLKSDEVLAVLRADLEAIGFSVERGKQADQKIERPVFFGENGVPTLRFEVDAYHTAWECGLEIEATRAIRGGALYRDLLQALVMVQVSHLCLGIPNFIRWGKGNKSHPYDEARRTVEALYGHSRIRFPYGLTIIGY